MNFSILLRKTESALSRRVPYKVGIICYAT